MCAGKPRCCQALLGYPLSSSHASSRPPAPGPTPARPTPRSGGSVSGYLIDHAPCPCLTIPYKAMGLSAEASGGEDEVAGISPRRASSPEGAGISAFLAEALGLTQA